MAPIHFDLTLFIKEMQLQHGLRAADYTRYHQYLSNRLATLRQQVHMSNDKKKFLKKEVTVHNATDARHLMLLALYAERCWASAEAQQEMCLAAKEGSRGEGNKPKGGIPPSDQYRKRLNKAVKWSANLLHIAEAVGSDTLKEECAAYHMETSGRAAASHKRYPEAKKMYMAARDGYYKLRDRCLKAGDQQNQAAVMVLKINELDDRVLYCMQHMGEDASSYSPPAVTGDHAGTMLTWNGRVLNVNSIKVKDALREARIVPVEEAQAKLLESTGPVAVGQSNKVLDLMDRRINSYNDALTHARQDLRNASEGNVAGKTEMQLIVHYFLYYVSQETLRRTLFLAELYSRRFRATEQVILSSSSPITAGHGPKAKRAGIAPAQFASPLEVVRLYEAASDAVGHMELLPGVAGSDEVEEWSAVCRAGKLVYTGESLRVSGDTVTAGQCYRAAVGILAKAKGKEARELHALAERADIEMSATNQLSSSLKSAAVTTATVPYLSEAKDTTVAVAQNILQFPPDYQAAPCKPVFVDIASTYVDFPCNEGEECVAQPVKQQHHQQQHSASTQQAKKNAPEKQSGTAAAASAEKGSKWSWKSTLGWGSS